MSQLSPEISPQRQESFKSEAGWEWLNALGRVNELEWPFGNLGFQESAVLPRGSPMLLSSGLSLLLAPGCSSQIMFIFNYRDVEFHKSSISGDRK